MFDSDTGDFNGEGIFTTQYTGGSANDIVPMVMTGNLLSTNWITVSNFSGDGTLKQFTFPTTNPPANYFRVRTR